MSEANPITKTEAKPAAAAGGSTNIIVAGLHQEITKTENKISRLKGKTTHDLNEIKTLQNEIADREKEILGINQDVTQKEHEVEEFEKQVEDFMKRIADMKNILNELETVGIKS